MIIKPCEFYKDPYFYEEIPENILNNNINYFDRDGYELTEVEQEIHKYFKIPLGNCLNHHSVCSEWIYINEPPIILDHSFICTRFGYKNDALSSISNKCNEDVRFMKLLKLKPKYGIDISIDYIDDKDVTELLHIEKDFNDINEATKTKKELENLIINLEFKEKAFNLMKEKEKWINLNSDDQSDYKSKIFGFNRAFENIKVY